MPPKVPLWAHGTRCGAAAETAAAAATGPGQPTTASTNTPSAGSSTTTAASTSRGRIGKCETGVAGATDLAAAPARGSYWRSANLSLVRLDD